ncbi:hypothetical protein [Vibrio owensii]|uniref:hypothetical protein n=1 Tax=Vibrio owensii TaxID=696485 RepID=UPI0018F23252|nr:hypothetical protein [Vibrio owensii]
MTLVGGSFSETLGMVLAGTWFLESEVGQQPVNARLIRCGKFRDLFGSRARGKYFINKVFKLDSQRSALLVANSSMVFKVVLLS